MRLISRTTISDLGSLAPPIRAAEVVICINDFRSVTVGALTVGMKPR